MTAKHRKSIFQYTIFSKRKSTPSLRENRKWTVITPEESANPGSKFEPVPDQMESIEVMATYFYSVMQKVSLDTV